MEAPEHEKKRFSIKLVCSRREIKSKERKRKKSNDFSATDKPEMHFEARNSFVHVQCSCSKKTQINIRVKICRRKPYDDEMRRWKRHICNLPRFFSCKSVLESRIRFKIYTMMFHGSGKSVSSALKRSLCSERIIEKCPAPKKNSIWITITLKDCKYCQKIMKLKKRHI